MNALDPASFPDFFIVGAAKAGTTAVWHWLRQHENVFLPDVKEPGYFAFNNVSARPEKGPYDPAYVARITTDSKSYSSLYRAAGSRLKGDASPFYLSHPPAAYAIARVRPDARIIVILRNPVERAFSQYLHHVRDGLEPSRSFEAALDAEPHRLANRWSAAYGYVANGHYPVQIARFLAVFPKDQVLFLEYGALQCDPEGSWGRICDHLNLHRRPIVLSDRVNATSTLSQVPGRPGISRHLTHPGPIQSTLKKIISPQVRTRMRQYLEGPGKAVPRLSDATRAALTQKYMQDRPQLEALVGSSLDHWYA
ncbi:sulfotransferase [Loktanella salsilacus]|uniref:sulfotransferase family protein n=1 Tax=Loktanella salsilacus TaxID=195913 RepID=UPI0030FBA5BF